jgi:hypothetical protein
MCLYSDWINETEFGEMCSMDRSNFWKLHRLICDHPIFKRGLQGPPQAKSEHQLLVLLAYLHTEGTGMCNESAHNVFYTSSGATELMRERVVTAVYEELLYLAVFLPNEMERKVISKSFFDEFQIPNVSSILDGTLFGLAFTPQREDDSDFKGRKGGYTLTCLITNDHKRRI